MDDTSHIPGTIFEQVDIDRVADAVVDQIERLIVTGVLQPGQRLPPERELSDSLGISRPKLREAFQVLAGRGLVEIRRSEGAFIRALSAEALSPPMIELFARHRPAFLDLLEYRREQESFAAHLAAVRATAADIETLFGLLDRMEAAFAEDDARTEARLDFELHMAIIEAAHNAVLVHVMRSIYALMTEAVARNRDFMADRPGARKTLLDQHREICEAIRRSHPEDAAEASERHIDFVAHAFREGEDETRRIAVARKRRTLRTRRAGAPVPRKL